MRECRAAGKAAGRTLAKRHILVMGHTRLFGKHCDVTDCFARKVKEILFVQQDMRILTFGRGRSSVLTNRQTEDHLFCPLHQSRQHPVLHRRKPRKTVENQDARRN